MAGIQVTMASYPGGAASPLVYYDPVTYANPAAAVAAIASGFLALNSSETHGGKVLETTVYLNVSQIQAIIQR